MQNSYRLCALGHVASSTRRLSHGWQAAGFDDSGWGTAQVVPAVHIGGFARTQPPTDPYGPLYPRPIAQLGGEVKTPMSLRLETLAGQVDTAIGSPVKWVEAAVGHLVNRSYAEPHWERKRGQVAAYEKVSLFGLTLVPRRKVNFGPIDPVQAREIFLRFALVEDDFETRAPFWRHNRDLVAYVHDLEAKSRRRDILVDDEAIYGFYAARVPDGVYSTPQFEKWLRQACATQPKLLHLRLDPHGQFLDRQLDRFSG